MEPSVLSDLPDGAWIAAMLILFVGVIYWGFRGRRRRPPDGRNDR